MGITLNVPEDIAAAASDIARRSGRETGQVLLEVLRVHFPPVPPDLQAEFDALETASDEDFARLAQAEDL